MVFTFPGTARDAFVPLELFVPSDIYPGFDQGECPPEAVLQSLFTWTNIWWVSFYLGYKSYNAQTLRMLNTIGLGTMPIFFGRQPHGYSKGILESLKKTNPARAAKYDLKKHQQKDEIHGNAAECRELGHLSGESASERARAARFPRGTIIYIDCEMSTADPNWLEYFDGYTEAVTSTHNGYRPGIYCPSGKDFLAFLAKHEELMQRQDPAKRFNPPIWVFDSKMITKNKTYTHEKPASGKGKGKLITSPKTFDSPFPEFSPKLSYRQASISQFAQACNLRWNELIMVKGKEKLMPQTFSNVDLNTSVFRDPSRGEAGNRGAFGTIRDKKIYNFTRLYEAAKSGVEFLEGELLHLFAHK